MPDYRSLAARVVYQNESGLALGAVFDSDSTAFDTFGFKRVNLELAEIVGAHFADVTREHAEPRKRDHRSSALPSRRERMREQFYFAVESGIVRDDDEMVGGVEPESYRVERL